MVLCKDEYKLRKINSFAYSYAIWSIGLCAMIIEIKHTIR